MVLFGVFVSQIIQKINNNADKWTWMESVYWAVQTVTTVGKYISKH